MIDLQNRIPVIVHNLKSSQNLRLRDVVNWHRLVRQLKGDGASQTKLDLYLMLYELLTGVYFQYKPNLGYREGVSFGDRWAEPADAGANPRPGRRLRVGWLLDSASHISGVSTTLKQWCGEAERAGEHLRVIHCDVSPVVDQGACLQPIGTIDLETYAGLRMHVPDVQETLSFIRDNRFDVLHLSTPGPMGMIGLAASWLFGIPVCATYHTDLPRYAATLGGDPRLEEASWNVMTWFYGKMTRIAAPSPPIRDDLTAHGLPADRIRLVGRGVDGTLFSPRFRDEGMRQSWNGRGPYYAIYVGRVSEEKNLPCLVDAYRRLSGARPDVGLVVAGEGPYLDIMRRELAGLPVTFTGFLEGEALSRAYASADLFVFPSETDTFGNVVLEAQASGLPVIASGKGGPKHCIVDGASGLVVDDIDGSKLARHIDQVFSDDHRLRQMSEAALSQARQFTPRRAFDSFWQMQQECVDEWDSGAVRVGYDGRLAGLRALAISRWFE